LSRGGLGHSDKLLAGAIAACRIQVWEPTVPSRRNEHQARGDKSAGRTAEETKPRTSAGSLAVDRPSWNAGGQLRQSRSMTCLPTGLIEHLLQPGDRRRMKLLQLFFNGICHGQAPWKKRDQVRLIGSTVD
jgi:hypothetical protein